METDEQICERIAKTIDPDNTFLDECEDAVQWMKKQKGAVSTGFSKGGKNG